LTICVCSLKTTFVSYLNSRL